MKQPEDENIQQYFIRLKQQAQKCSFREQLDNEIKRQLEHSTTSNKLRRYSSRNPTLSLTQILVDARTLEDTDIQAVAVEKSEINIKAEPEDPEVNRIKHTKSKIHAPPSKKFSSHSKPSVKSCFLCGGSYPHPDGRCRAVDKICHNGQKIGHFANVCRSTASSKSY